MKRPKVTATHAVDVHHLRDLRIAQPSDLVDKIRPVEIGAGLHVHIWAQYVSDSDVQASDFIQSQTVFCMDKPPLGGNLARLANWVVQGEICAHRPRTEGEVSSADPVPGPSEETTWAANATHRNTRFSVSFSTRSIWEVTVQLAFRARGSIRGHRMRTEGVSNGNLLTSAICPLASGCNHICKRAYLCQFRNSCLWLSLGEAQKKSVTAPRHVVIFSAGWSAAMMLSISVWTSFLSSGVRPSRGQSSHSSRIFA